MNTKEYLIKEIQSHVISFNEFWEDPITESALVKNTLETAESIKSYCEMLEVYHKQHKKVKHDYNEYPKFIQQTIDEIVSLVNDDRDLHHKVLYEHIGKTLFDEKIESREFDHYVEKNGHIKFENDPFYWISGDLGVIKYCDDLITLLSSEEKMNKEVDFSEITKSKLFYDFEGYEDGSMQVKFDKIFIKMDGKENRVLFDGEIVYYTTDDSHTVDYPGIVTIDAENYDITKLPYCDEDDFYDEEGDIDCKMLFEFIKKHKALTREQVIKEAQQAIENYIKYIKH